jgi:hypothetical protein
LVFKEAAGEVPSALEVDVGDVLAISRRVGFKGDDAGEAVVIGCSSDIAAAAAAAAKPGDDADRCAPLAAELVSAL